MLHYCEKEETFDIFHVGPNAIILIARVIGNWVAIVPLHSMFLFL